MKNKFGVWAVVIIIVLAVVILLAKSGFLSLSPQGDQSNAFIDCVDGCLKTYDEDVIGIWNDFDIKMKICCMQSGGAGWVPDNPPNPTRPYSGQCVILDGEPGKKHNNELFKQCMDEFDVEQKLVEANEKLKDCIIDCQTQATTSGE